MLLMDINNSDYVMQGIKRLAHEQNITVLCVSHDQEIIEKYADTIVEIVQDLQGIRNFIVR